MIHVEGMGILGGILAWNLHRRGIRFTWNDTEQEVCAWRASTGCIYPSGDAFDRWNYEAWKRWLLAPPWGEPSFIEKTGWWYCTKAAPHGAKDKPDARSGALQRGSAFSMHFNSQRFVATTRAAFHDRRVERAPATGQRIVAHGFGARRHHYVWGWNRKVKLGFAPGLLQHERLDRPSLYFREGRFVMAYAYATPGEPWWYAGSSLIVQKGEARHLEIPPKYERWKENFLRLGDGNVNVIVEGPITEGWRPAAAESDSALASTVDGAILLKPLWNSGIRHAPAVIGTVLEILGAK